MLDVLKDFILNKNDSKFFIYIYLFILGGVNTFSFAPYDIWGIVFFTFAAFFALLDNTNEPKNMFLYGFTFGFGWFTFGLSWIHVGLAVYGGTPLFFTILFVMGVFSLLSLVPALSALFTHYYKAKFGFPIFIVFWVFCEWLRTWLLTGFPWLTIGYSQMESPFGGFAPIFGEIGIQTIMLCTSYLIYKAFVNISKEKTILSASKNIAPIIAILLIAIGTNQITWIEEKKKDLTVTLVQGNIDQGEKWNIEYENSIMDKFLNLSKPHFDESDLIIWSEAAIPRIESYSSIFLRNLNDLAYKTDTAVVLGIMDTKLDTKKSYNNIIVAGKKDEKGFEGDYHYDNDNRYQKHHLLLIGEFVPFEELLRGITPLFNLPMSSLSKGDAIQDNIVANGWKIASAICFEIVFPTLFLDNVYSGDDGTDFLLTVGNETWFGINRGLWQHVQIAQMRSKEFAKPTMRVSNTGVTAIIDHNGEILEYLPLFEDGTLTKTMPIYKSETFYQNYGRIPNYIFLFILMSFCYYRKSIKK